jgi:16S rRNA (adenine1518-N6/adenine1519-N6)-dimethyltransferase
MRSPEELKARLQAMGLAPKKALGQNFLINDHVIEKIVAAVRAHSFSTLVEIGPGLGALTEPLLRSGLKPLILEVDPDLIAYWRTRDLNIVEGDALQLDWTSLPLVEPTLLVSNLPYQISTHIVIDRCLGPKAVKFMVLMFQKEVAQRLTAKPFSKEYGVLSVMAQLHFRLRKVADASPRDFFPAPKVASRVLEFERLSVQGLDLPFLKFVKAAFAFRRKLLLKNLRGMVDKSKHEVLAEALKTLGHSEKARAEELSPQDFERLFKKVYEH